MFESEIEKRSSKRFNVDGIYGYMLFSSDLNIVNMSVDGMAIETNRRLNIDKEYTLKIKYKDENLNLKGLVVWSILSRTEARETGEIVPIYKAGIRFTNVLTENAVRLFRFIEENKSESLEKRLLGVRFRIGSLNCSSVIDFPYEYKIKRLSLSGMLIETDSMLDIDSTHEMMICPDNREISVVGRIANCSAIEKDDLTKYEIGIEFVKMSDESKDYLKQFLDGLDIRDDKTRKK